MIHWEGQEAWLFPLRQIGSGKANMLKAIDRMTPGDMPSFDPALQMSIKALQGVKDAMTKHVIVISDGDPTPPTRAGDQPARDEQDHRDRRPRARPTATTPARSR